jgi:peptidoglycan hydrolase CwlO-like protein
LRGDIDHTYERIQEIEAAVRELDEKIQKTDKQRADLKKETTGLSQNKENIEKKIFDIRALIVQRETELLERNRAQQAEDRALKSLDASIAKSKSQMEVFISEYDQLYHNLADHTAELERQNLQNEKTEQDIEEKGKYVEDLQTQLRRVNKEIGRVNALRDLCITKVTDVEASRHSAEQKIDSLNKDITSIREQEIVGVRKEIESLDKQAFAVKQELDILRKKYVGSERASKAMNDLVMLNKNGKINLTLEIKVLFVLLMNYYISSKLFLHLYRYWKRKWTTTRRRFVTYCKKKTASSTTRRSRISSTTRPWRSSSCRRCRCRSSTRRSRATSPSSNKSRVSTSLCARIAICTASSWWTHRRRSTH